MEKKDTSNHSHLVDRRAAKRAWLEMATRYDGEILGPGLAGRLSVELQARDDVEQLQELLDNAPRFSFGE